MARADAAPLWEQLSLKALLRLSKHPITRIQGPPYGEWIHARGGIAAVQRFLADLPTLSQEQRRLLGAILAHPEASVIALAERLRIDVRTYNRWLARLLPELLDGLNSWVDAANPPTPPAGAGQPGGASPSRRPPLKLPSTLTRFIGRGEELGAVRALLLADNVRMLTLTGPGGIGKTRLAIRAAEESVGAFPDGVFFIGLAAVREPDLVPIVIAQTLEIPESAERTPGERLLSYLQGRRLLLVLDNFEQIVQAAPLIPALLEAAPASKVLVTSRERLQLSGEHEWVVPPLATRDTRPSPADAADSPAIALFLDRARSVQPDFQLTEETAPVVAAICQRLDGLPLAIELAAARAKSLPPHFILERLSQRLTFLTGGPRDLPARQQTLRSAIDWSYDLLSQQEQLFFRQLGCFVDGWSLAAAEQVCATPGAAPGSGLDLITSLIDKSLIQPVRTQQTQPRFSMLETIREYAIEQLLAHGELEQARQRHATYLVTLVESLEVESDGLLQQEWLDRLEAEHGNLRMALAWSLEHDDSTTILRLVGAIWRFWQMHGHVSERSRWTELALAARGLPQDPRYTRARSKVLRCAGWTAFEQGIIEQARACFDEGDGLARELGDAHLLGLVLHGVGAVARASGDFARSRRIFEESLALFEQTGDMVHVAWSNHHLGAIALQQGLSAQAIPFFEQAMLQFRSLGQQWALAEALDLYSCAVRSGGDYQRTLASQLESLALYQALGDQRAAAATLSQVGVTALYQRAIPEALEALCKSLAIFHGLGNQLGIVVCVECLAVCAAEQGQPERAALLFGAAEASRREFNLAGWLDHQAYQDLVAPALATLTGQHLTDWAEGRARGLEPLVRALLAQGRD